MNGFRSSALCCYLYFSIFVALAEWLVFGPGVSCCATENKGYFLENPNFIFEENRSFSFHSKKKDLNTPKNII